MGNSRRHAAGSGESTASWQFNDLPAGYYKVYATWSAAGDQATNAPFTVYDGSSVVGANRVNQQIAPAGETADGTVWQLVGSYWIGSGQMRVELSDDANGAVVADAIRIVDPATLYWDPAPHHLNMSGGGDGTWDSGANWYDPVTHLDVVWSPWSSAVFAGTAGNVTISGQVQAPVRSSSQLPVTRLRAVPWSLTILQSSPWTTAAIRRQSIPRWRATPSLPRPGPVP